MRLFAAFPLPDLQREHLVSALRPLRSDRDLRWTEPEQWHLTLGFYGHTSADAIVDHITKVARLHSPLELHLKGAGSFNRANFWIGVGGDTAQLSHLMSDCDPEDSRRRAHVTVARVRQRWSMLIDDHVRAFSVYSGPSWRATSLDIVSSELGKGRSGGPLHSVIETVPLTGL